MIQTTIWDFLPQESSNEAKPTNQRNIMQFNSLEEVFDYIRRQQDIGTQLDSGSAGGTQHGPEECLDCKLAQLDQAETILIASVCVNALEVIQNTLQQSEAIRSEQADTLVKLAQLRNLLRNT